MQFGTARRCESRTRLGVLLLAAAFVGCAEAGIYSDDCYRVVLGALDFDSAAGSFSFGGVCIYVLHPACARLKDFKFVAGVDDNNDGVLQPAEEIINVNNPTPIGSPICAGAVSGSIGSGHKGSKLLWNFSLSKGNDASPFISRHGELTLK